MLDGLGQLSKDEMTKMCPRIPLEASLAFKQYTALELDRPIIHVCYLKYYKLIRFQSVN